jgi:hypothetical protein
MLNYSEEFEKNKNLNDILNAFDKLSPEAKQIVLTMAEFIIEVDGKIDEGEMELFNIFKKRLESIDDVNKKLVIYINSNISKNFTIILL